MIEEKDQKDYILVDGADMEVSIVRTKDDAAAPAAAPAVPAPRRRWKWLAALLGLVALALALVVGRIAYNRYYNIGVPISRQPAENIELLKQTMHKAPAQAPGVSLTSDSILGVAMDFYRLDGLRGTLSLQQPDSADADVFLYVRSADYLADGTFICSTVVNGELLPSTRDQRNGYVAMAGNGTVIGVSRSNKVRDFVAAEGGSFFRQFILVSNGVLPHRFYLHGKVERRALGRLGDTLYIISTRHKETMWDFADALREYGFVDAIYITGGDDRTFYRTADGQAHTIGTDSTHTAGVPWLVFRR